jgi:hypothetical protein
VLLWIRLIVDWNTTQLRDMDLKDEELREIARAMRQTRSGSIGEVLRVVRQPFACRGGKHNVWLIRCGRYRLRAGRGLCFYIFPAMAMKSEVFRYGWLRAFASGAGVPTMCRFSPFSMSCTRPGRPWQSSFWLSPLQKQIARSILNLSSAAITTTELYSKRLLGLREDSTIRVTAMPVFSNVGEPGCGARQDLLFGTYRAEIERIISALSIETIFDVGSRLFPMPRTLAACP